MPAIIAVAALSGAVVAAVTGGAILGTALLYAGLAAGSYLINKALAPKPSKLSLPDLSETAGTGSQTRTTTLDSTTAARWVLGRARTAGFLAWVKEEGEDAIHIVYALSEGPCHGLHKVYIEGEDLNIVAGGTSYTGATAYLPGASSDYRGKAEFWFYSGDSRTGAPASLAAVDSSYWDATHTGVNLCFVHAKFTQPNYGQGTQEVDYDSRFWTGVPQCNFVIDGIKITWPGQTTPTWTRNAAAIRYWYETERLDRPSSAIDEASVRAAVTTCGTRVGSGTGEDLRFTIDGILTSDDHPRSVLDDMDFAMQGFVFEQDGKLKFVPGREVPSSEGRALDVDSHMIRFQGAQPAPALSDRVNAISMSLDQSYLHDWLAADIEEVTDTTAMARDGRKLSRDLSVKRFVSNPYTGRRLMAIALRRARAAATYSYQIAPGNSFENLTYLPGDLVLLSDISRGLDAARMMVTHQTLNSDWSVNVTMIETPLGIYADDAVVQPQQPRRFILPRSSAQPTAPGNLTAVQNLSFADDGALRSRASVSWDAVPFTSVIQVVNADSSFKHEATITGNSTDVDLPGTGVYTIRVHHRNARNVDGIVGTVNLTVDWSTLTPPTPSLVSISSQGNTVHMILATVTRRDITSMSMRYHFSTDTSANLSIVDEAAWSTATDFGLVPVNRGTDGRMYASFQTPLTGRFRFGARYISRHSSQSLTGDLGSHNLVSGQTITWRGPWNNSTNYIVGDIVSHNSSAWIAVAINSNSEPATTSTDWDEFAEGGIAGQDGAPGRDGTDGTDGTGFNWRGAWDSAATYAVNDIVQHEGSAWISTVASTNEEPTGASGFWDLYAQAGEPGDDGTGFNWRGVWSSTVTYQINDLVRHSGSAWVATNASTNQTPSTTSNFWNEFAAAGDDGDDGAPGRDGQRGAQGDGFQWRGAWSSTVQYAVRDVVHHDKGAWVATSANLNETPSTTNTNWNTFADGGQDGAAGSAGADGAGYQFIFRRTTTDTAPTAPTTTAAQRTNDSYVPTGWSDDPTGVDGTNLYEWVSVRIGTSGAWGEYSSPAIWARFSADGSDGAPGARGAKGDQGDTGAAGQDGADGSGFEMVFRRTTTDTEPANITTTAAQRTTDDHVPTNWTDDPTGVDATNRFEWVSIRTGTSGAWSEFSEPSLWARFSADGAAGEAGADGAGYRWRGAWSSTTAYVINDIVRNDGKAWVCINAHTNDEPS